MGLCLTECTDIRKWDAFAGSSPQGNVFCTSWFIRAIEEEHAFLFLEENDLPQVGAVIAKKNGVVMQGQYPFTMYQGILYSGAHLTMPPHKRVKRELELTGEFLARLAERYDRLFFCLHYAVGDVRGFQWFHYHEPQFGQFFINVGYTGIIDLTSFKSFEEYLLSIRSVRRNEYRRASSSGMVADESEDVDLLDRLHEATFQRQSKGRDPVEALGVTRIARLAIAEGYGTLLVCKNTQGIAMSATLFLYYKGCAYYLVGANDMAYRDTGSGVYLLLENIKLCFDMGIKRIDVVGINSPNRGDFKTSFGAVPVPYFIVNWEQPR